MAHQFNSGYGQAPNTPAGGNPPQSTSSQPTPPPQTAQIAAASVRPELPAAPTQEQK